MNPAGPCTDDIIPYLEELSNEDFQALSIRLKEKKILLLNPGSYMRLLSEMTANEQERDMLKNKVADLEEQLKANNYQCILVQKKKDELKM